MKVVVLAGGLSKERDVSMASGSLIANALLENGHKVILIDLYKDIRIQKENFEELFLSLGNQEKYNYIVPEVEPDLDELKKYSGNGEALIGKNVLQICQEADVVFNALHGGAGENGQLQAFFDIYGIKYTGTGYVGALLAMDKALTKTLLRAQHIHTPRWITKELDSEKIFDVGNTIGYPCVVKPCSNGSSVGVTFADNEEQLKRAMKEISQYETEVIIEEVVRGREFSVGILEGQALPVIEIIPTEGFYDYKNKYQVGGAIEICPAKLNKEQTEQVQQQALNVHQILKLGSYSRIDFILDQNGEFTCLEANTLPGMTPTSLLPQEAKVAGISYNELCEKIITLIREEK